MTRFTLAIVLSLLMFPAAGAVMAQEADPIERFLYPPELVMRHQNRIDLGGDQKAELRKRVSEAQTRFTELQWEFQDAAERLGEMLAAERLEEKQILEQVDRVLDKERTIKRTQMQLMIRIRNLLTPDQRAQLDQLRGRGAPPGN